TNNRIGIIVASVAWDVDPAIVGLGNRILDFKLQRAKRLALKRNFDLMLAMLERADVGNHQQCFTQREGDWLIGRDLGRPECRAIAEIQGDRLGRNRSAIDRNALQLGKLSIAKTILDRELNPAIDILQA